MTPLMVVGSNRSSTGPDAEPWD